MRRASKREIRAKVALLALAVLTVHLGIRRLAECVASLIRAVVW